MNADYLNAHKRHFDDAKRLFEASSLATADHLYGLSAECGLKRLMLAFGMPFDLSKDMPGVKNDRVHIDKLWARYETYRSGHAHGAKYALPTADPFKDWEVSQRYANEANFNEVRVRPHQQGTEAIHKLMGEAHLEGLV